MGSIIYDHLNNSLLLDASLIASQFQGVAESELRQALQQYRNFCISHFDQLLEEVSPETGKLRLYIGDFADQRLLKQGAFYLDTVIMSDPLFKLTEPQHKITSVWSEAMGVPHPHELNRVEVTQAARILHSYRSLVASGYVRFFPTSLENEAPTELPFYAPSDGFENILPPHLLALYKDSANVKSVVSTPKGLLIQRHLEIGRRIHVDFDGKDSGLTFGYDLIQQETVALDRESGVVKMRMHMPTTLPTKEFFDAWVSQSINSSARQHFERLHADIRWSAKFGAQYLTRSQFAASVLDYTDSALPSSIQSSTSSGWLNLDLTIFNDVSMERLLAARADEEAFRRFRLQLEKHFREIRFEADPEKRRQKTENAMHELVDIQLNEVDSAIQRLRRKGVLSGVGVLVSLAAATATSGASLIATMCATYAGYKTFEEYRISAKESPSFFLWRTLGRKRT
ncbi:hypothetical protein [Rhodoferax mekongensis]|uniref:hypothetical protein n=1 Tax=Rhodoferax mekongensis TaxID=3068341 RepID=UPI0028BE9484|nr:hypothetical protein [Rhodoferax sp. TBRC 17199]MDT7517002.1 hypothetical protein [Rhodoferax sp. TBRC 17199]